MCRLSILMPQVPEKSYGNTLTSEQVCCGIGIFGLVIPTDNFNRFLPREGPMRKEYNEPLIQQSRQDEEYYGETNVDIFRYEGE